MRFITEIGILYMLLNVLEPELLRPRFNKLYEFYLQKYITKSLVKRNGTGVCVCGREGCSRLEILEVVLR